MSEAVKKAKKKEKVIITRGQAYIKSSFNNTIVTISDLNGNSKVWSSAGKCGFKGSKQATPYAGQKAAEDAATKAKDLYSMEELEVYVKGPGPSRDATIRALSSIMNIVFIKDVTGTPHNGCRGEKERRV